VAETFDEVRELAEPELRQLLEHGRPEERVWAIWALALRSSDAFKELARQAQPDAGVRRTLAVVLAGHGELELLVALARCDPAADVRAAAMHLVARLALEGKLPIELVQERAAAEGPVVRIAILGAISAGTAAWLLDLAITMLDASEGDVRYEAFEALVRANASSHALAWLEELPEAETRLVLMRWTSRAPGGDEPAADRVGTCAQLLANASRRVRRLLVESVGAATWHSLAPAIRDEPSLITAFVRHGHHAIDEIPTAVLMAAQLREHQDTWLGVLRSRLSAQQSPDAELGALIPEYLERCEKRLSALDSQLAELRKANDIEDAELEQVEAHREELAVLCELAVRSLVH
jgi:hypothetical protein